MSKGQTVGALFGVPGQALWAKQGVGGESIVIDTQGALIAAGRFQGSITVGSTTLTSKGKTDIYVVKLASTTGDVIWAKSFGGAGDDYARAIAVDSSDRVYVTGEFSRIVDFGDGPIVVSETSDLANAFVLQLSSDGGFGWVKRLGGDSFAVGIAVRGSSVVVVGTFSGWMIVDETTLISSKGTSDIFAISLTPNNGATYWIRSFGGTDQVNAGDVVIDTSSNVVITGTLRGQADFGGGVLLSPNYNLDVLLLKLDGTTGSHLFSQRYGGEEDDHGLGVSVDEQNNIIMAGDFRNTANFGCEAVLSAPKMPNENTGYLIPTYGYLVKITQAGACVWAKSFNGSGVSSAKRVAVDALGNIAVAGSFCGVMNLGGVILVAAGACRDNDIYAARFAPDGLHLNSVRAGGVGAEFAQDVAQGSDGRFYVTGTFQGLAEFGGTAFYSDDYNEPFIVALEAL